MRRFVFWLLVLGNVVSLPLLFIALLSPALFSHLSRFPIFERAYNLADRSLEYNWETDVWVAGAAPDDIGRHRALLAAQRNGALEGSPGAFMITGHRIVPGKGVTLGIRQFRFRPHPVVAGTNRTFEKVTLYLPDGLPAEGEVVSFGIGTDDNAPFAFLTSGGPAGGEEEPVCFGYARRGTVQVVKSSDGRKPDQEGADGVSAENSGGGILVLNVSLEFAPQRWWEGNGGPTACGYYYSGKHYPVSWAGRIAQIWFFQKRIGELEAWEGGANGPIEAGEFRPEGKEYLSLGWR